MSGIRLEHVALWTRDLERMREFYLTALNGHCGARYENRHTGFRSYFVEFDGGARLELMSRPVDTVPGGPAAPVFGYAHVAFQLDSRSAVDEWVARLEAAGATILGRPRQTGDGYYEAVVVDPEHNTIELMAVAAVP
jgi:lactoylglutathione lyase